MEGQPPRRVRPSNPPQHGQVPPPQRVPPRYRYGPQSHTGRVPWNFGSETPLQRRSSVSMPGDPGGAAIAPRRSPPGRRRTRRLPNGQIVYADGTPFPTTRMRWLGRQQQKLLDSMSARGADPDTGIHPDEVMPTTAIPQQAGYDPDAYHSYQ